MRKKTALIVLILVFSVVSLAACSRAEQFVYGTTLSIEIEGVGAIKTKDAIISELSSYEDILSPTREGSDIYRINNARAGESINVSALTAEVLGRALEMYEETDGAYDPSVYPLVRLWEFDGDSFSLPGARKQPPEDDEIAAALACTGMHNFAIDLDARTVTKSIDGAMLDLGGIVKGYALAKAVGMMSGRQRGLINLGGSVGGRGRDYLVAIGTPRPSAFSHYGTFTLGSGECVSTGGDYERYYLYENDEGGVDRYHHILDPSTGRPANTESEDGIIAASVVSADGAFGDALTTALVVMGRARAEAYLAAHPDIKAVLIFPDMNCYVSGGLQFTKS